MYYVEEKYALIASSIISIILLTLLPFMERTIFPHPASQIKPNFLSSCCF
jgi:hypothetical protein